MKRFKNILLVYNGEAKENALLQRAVDRAKRNRAKLAAVDVVEELPGAFKLFYHYIGAGGNAKSCH